MTHGKSTAETTKVALLDHPWFCLFHGSGYLQSQKTVSIFITQENHQQLGSGKTSLKENNVAISESCGVLIDFAPTSGFLALFPLTCPGCLFHSSYFHSVELFTWTLQLYSLVCSSLMFQRRTILVNNSLLNFKTQFFK